MRLAKVEASRLWRIGAIFLIGALFFCTLPRSLPDFDAAEFIVIAKTGGIAHPPGYPLYLMLLRGAAWAGSSLPPVPLLAALSVVFSLVSLWFMFGLVEALVGSSRLAFASTVAVFLSAPVWRCSTTIEPFALNLLLAALVLTVIQRLISRSHDSNRLVWIGVLGALFGLGFCNHHTLVFLLPLALFALWHSRTKVLPATLSFFGGALLGLVPLLYFSFHQQGPLVWGDWSHFYERLIIHLFRREYGTFSLASGNEASWYRAPVHLVQQLLHDLSYLYLVAAILGVYSLLKKKVTEPQNGFLVWGILGTAILAGPLMFSLFHMETGLAELPAMDRFSAFPIFLLAPLIGFGLSALQKQISNSWLRAILVYGLLGLHGFVQYPIAERRSETIYEQYAENVFRIAPQNSVIFSFGDVGFYACLYRKYAHHLRPDIDCLNSAMLASAWYQKQLMARYGKPGEAFSLGALFSGRPAYSTDPSSWLRHNSPNAYPFGVLIKIPGPEGVPNSSQLVAINEKLYRNELKLPSDHQIRNAKPWEKMVLWNYGIAWETLANLLASTDRNLAEICRRRARVFGAPPERFY